MAEPLPPLNGVRTFEVAARLGSYSAAARELHVTHGAVSRAIAGLEGWLGVKLFTQVGRRMELTDVGRTYADAIRGGLAAIQRATAEVAARGGKLLRVEAPPTLTVRWLIPRLPRFHEREPSVQVRVHTAERVLASEAPDVLIRRGPGSWPGLVATRFLREDATPVAAPKVVGRRTLRVDDLARQTWIHAEARADAWREWAKTFGARRLAPARELRFDHFYLALQAALDGLGFAMGPLPVVADDLAARRLVAPFPDKVLATHSYVALVARRAEPAALAFVRWLVEEGAGSS